MENNTSGAQPEILIVEDSPVEAEMLRRILVRSGYRVHAVAKNGEAGLQALREHPCALVMSDINMPHMNGYELCHAIKLDDKLWGTPVILVTSLSDPKDIIKALDVGADGYVTKPYVEDVLLGRIRSLLANPARRKLAEERRKIQLEYGGESHSVSVGSPQMANLLLSVYENSLILNQELMRIQNQLNVLNENLEEKIRERTVSLQVSEARFRNLVETTSDWIWEVNENAVFTYASPKIHDLLGYLPEEVIGKTPFDLMTVEEAKRAASLFGTIVAARAPIINLENINLHKSGHRVVLETNGVPVIDREGNFCGYRGIDRDITTRKQTEAKILAAQAELQELLAAANQSRRTMLSVIEDQKRAEAAMAHANRALAALSAVNRTLVRAASEEQLLQSICQAIVEQRGYRLAWVGYVQHDASQSIQFMARAGHDEGYLDALQITWAETERGMGPSGRAVRSGTTQLCQDMAHDLQFSPWRDAALKRGYAASIALPLMDENDNKVFGILNVYAEEVNAFSPSEVNLLEEMAGDLAFGVHTLHTRHERDLSLVKNQEQLVQLQDNLEDTVRAIATIVEMRDPYTAGHQLRVADLAAAIAKQMGLPEEQIHAIHLAGVVHDLGKIQIPAEILSKPGKINDIEYSLIKMHPQASYDILKGIDFPWPIAQMVLQHHERINGSGYPQGLKDDAILLEARILSVADVVEAISAHRPYRPGLGIEAALAEISKQRGTHFDPLVVDACVALIREHSYVFPK